jgi:hypothetical protein
MLSNKERQELLEKHQQAQFRNKMRLLIMGALFTFTGAVGMTVDPDKAQAFVIVLLLGLCAIAIAAQD